MGRPRADLGISRVPPRLFRHLASDSGRSAPRAASARRGATMSEADQEFEAYLTRCVGDLGATLQAATVLIGDELGLYRAMATGGPCTAADLGERTGTAERYVAEWLRAQ